MKGILFQLVTGFVLLSAIVPQNGLAQLPATYSANVKPNYVRTWTAIKPDTSSAKFNANTYLVTGLMKTQYIDGIGQPFQTVTKMGSIVTGSNPIDMVTTQLYDEFGREKQKYLPFAANSTGGNSSISDGFFKLNPFQQDSTFNKGMFPDETWYYSQTNFEASLLNRPLEIFAPGNSWVGTSGENNESNRRSVKMKYWSNTTTDSVRIWKVTDVENNFGTYDTGTGRYAANQLYKNVTVDEHGKQVIEFKDKEGLVILKKVQLTAAADTGTGKGYNGWLCTYYIYDDLNNLRAVIQPEGVKQLAISNWQLTTTLLNEQCFRYEYDKRNRMVMKKVPGAGRVWMVYDARDRLVLTQDSVMRAAHEWLYMQYDELNRPIATGKFTDNTNYNNLSYHANKADTSIKYPWPGIYTIDTLTKTFYDDYTWRNGQGNPLSATRSTAYDGYLQSPSDNNWPYARDATIQSNEVKGMVTGTKTKVLGTVSDYLYSVSFYDDKARVIQTQSTNISNGTDIILTQYTWTGQPLLTITKNEKSGINNQTSVVLTKMSYDSLQRLLTIQKKVSNSKVSSGAMPNDWTKITEHEYNALGQLKTKRIGATPVDSLKYDYNIRGWMLGMNRTFVKDTTSTINYFGFDLGYDKTDFTANGNSKSYAAAQYNGNITGMLWRSTGDDQLRKYDFTYDAVNRVLSADFNQFNNGNFSKAAGIDFTMYGMSYDANGNILSMNQKGLKGIVSQTIDSLLYTYITNSNRLLNVLDRKNDTATRLGDFRSSKAYMTALSNNKTTAATDYSYDINGNLTNDKNKDISSIIYNHLNLPDSIRITGKGTIKYTYDATGNKLKKVTRDSTVSPVKVTTTLYMFGNFINDTLQFVGTEEGRVRFKQANSTLQYDYFIKDHLGNVRMVLTEEKDTSFYGAATMEVATISNEETYYGNLTNTQDNKPAWFSDPLYGTNAKVARIKNASGSQKIGPNMILKVMAGDKYNIRVASGWSSGSATNSSTNVLNDLLSLLSTGAAGLSGGKVTAGDLSGGSSGLNTGLTDFLFTQTTSGSKPKAYINWILLDEQFKIVLSSSGFEQVGASGSATIHTKSNLTVDKNGYLYIYTSNEATNIDVFFDNLQVTHMRGPITEETHYYPFGLTIAGISSRSVNFGKDNKHKFNEGTELANKEFIDGSGLELYETPFRSYDAQIGRFWQIDLMAASYESWSPYTFAVNNPISLNDPTGLATEGPDNVKTLPEVIVRSTYRNKWNYTDWSRYWDRIGNFKNFSQSTFNYSLFYNDFVQRGVDERGLRLAKLAFDAIEYRKRLAAIEASWRSFVEQMLLEGATWAAGGLVVKIGGRLVKIGYRAYKLQMLRQGENGAQYLYHYTTDAYAKSIMETGMTVTEKRPLLYLTNNGNLTPLQAQIELALPANRPLPSAVLKINVTGMDPVLIRRATGNLPGMGAGGGTEFLFNQNIPSNLIQWVK